MPGGTQRDGIEPMTPALLVDEGPHHAVFSKPAGMTVVAGRGVPRPTLLDVAVERFGEGVRPVHRIDRPTTGLCVVAKTPYGQQALSEAFRRHLVDKRYLAVVEGSPAFDKLDIDARLSRQDDPDARKGPMAHQHVADDGVRALTRVRVLARGDGIALVEARPETGRMHQIRAHLAHVGHPIVGDAQYGATTAYVQGAVMLHAFAVSFPLPQGGRAFVIGPPPAEYVAFLGKRGIVVVPIIDDLRAAFTAASAKAAASSSAPAKRPSSSSSSSSSSTATRPRAPALSSSSQASSSSKPGAAARPAGAKRAASGAKRGAGGSARDGTKARPPPPSLWGRRDAGAPTSGAPDSGGPSPGRRRRR